MSERCAVCGAEAVIYLQVLPARDPGAYVRLCREHARSRRSLGYVLTPMGRKELSSEFQQP